MCVQKNETKDIGRHKEEADTLLKANKTQMDVISSLKESVNEMSAKSKEYLDAMDGWNKEKEVRVPHINDSVLI